MHQNLWEQKKGKDKEGEEKKQISFSGNLCNMKKIEFKYMNKKMEEMTNAEIIELMCSMVVHVYVKEDNISLFAKGAYEEFDIEIEEDTFHETLENDLNIEYSVFDSYEREFRESMEKLGSPQKSYRFSVDYREENIIPIMLNRISTDNDATIIISLVTGSRYLGGEEYETVAYVINSDGISHGRHNRFGRHIPHSDFLAAARALNLGG